jgi:hypothetical protein
VLGVRFGGLKSVKVCLAAAAARSTLQLQCSISSVPSPQSAGPGGGLLAASCLASC